MKDDRYTGSTFFKPEDIKGAYRTGDSPNTCVIPVVAAIEQLNAKRDEAMEEAKKILEDMLLDYHPEHIDKMGVKNCGSRSVAWLQEYFGEK